MDEVIFKAQSQPKFHQTQGGNKSSKRFTEADSVLKYDSSRKGGVYMSQVSSIVENESNITIAKDTDQGLINKIDPIRLSMPNSQYLESGLSTKR